jgi:hypothetical protein
MARESNSVRGLPVEETMTMMNNGVEKEGKRPRWRPAPGAPAAARAMKHN